MLQYAFNSWLNGYKKMFCYYGRERRSAFGYFILIQFVLLILIALICGRLLRGIQGFGDGTISELIIYAYFIGGFFATISYNVRRLHDANLSGWFCLFYLGFSGIVIIVSIFLQPTIGNNQYGPDPKRLNTENEDKKDINLIIN